MARHITTAASGVAATSILPGEHRQQRGAADQLGRLQRTRFQNHLQHHVFAGFAAQHFDFVGHLVVMSFEHLADVDDDVDLVGSVLDGHRRFEHLHFQKGLRRRKSARDARNAHRRIVHGEPDRFDERRIDADGRDIGDRGIIRIELHGLPCKSRHRLHRIAARKGRQVDGRIAKPVNLVRFVSLRGCPNACDLFGHLRFARGRSIFR